MCADVPSNGPHGRSTGPTRGPYRIPAGVIGIANRKKCQQFECGGGTGDRQTSHTLGPLPPLPLTVVVSQKPGPLLCGPGSLERSAKVQARPCHPSALFPTAGLLDSVLTPCPGGKSGRESAVYAEQVYNHYKLNHSRFAVSTSTCCGARSEHLQQRRSNCHLHVCAEQPGDLGRPHPKRPNWRRTMKIGAAIYEANRVTAAKSKREAHKSQQPPPLNANAQPGPTCPRCQREFRARFGLIGHPPASGRHHPMSPRLRPPNRQSTLHALLVFHSHSPLLQQLLRRLLSPPSLHTIPNSKLTTVNTSGVDSAQACPH
nr:unnamed protein product [Spirometra erinaceieuropaei]